jgi:hypothetical protein
MDIGDGSSMRQLRNQKRCLRAEDSAGADAADISQPEDRRLQHEQVGSIGLERQRSS